MKKIIILSAIIGVIVASSSCTRNDSETKPTDTSITAESFKKYKQDAEGNLFVTLNEYFDQPVTSTNVTLSASFKKNKQAVNIGAVMINNKYELEHSTNNNYLLNTGIDAKEFLDKPVHFELNTNNPDFPSIKIPTEGASNFSVKTNTGVGYEGILKKGQDITLKWTPKNANGNITQRSSDVVYLGIAASGASPVTREVPDNGQVTISAADLSTLPINSQAVIRLGRVTQNCTTQNGRTVCVNVVSNSSSGPLIVQ